MPTLYKTATALVLSLLMTIGLWANEPTVVEEAASETDESVVTETPDTVSVETDTEATADEAPVNASVESDAASEASKTEATEEAEEEVDPEEERLKELRRERELLQAENAVIQERTRFALAELTEERSLLEAENNLARERLNAELRERRMELERIGIEIEELNRASQLAGALRKIELENELAALRADEERMRARNALAQQEFESQMAEMRLMDARIKMERQELEMRLARVQAEVQFREVQDVYRDRISDQPEYTVEVFDGERLYISDRRIPLNGPIWGGTADHVQQRIDFFNNQDPNYPIFIVIDYSPGGSVMAGYRILKAMEGSKAPVYVVVRSFAASMAATITTLAEKSFAYPNAIILHHQVMWGGFGNLTQQRERLRETEEWWQRLATPIAKKMGISLDEFVTQMYERFSDGDWREFADKAVELNWVDHIVDEITEVSINRNPNRFNLPSAYALDEEVRMDDKGRPYQVLPRLAPFDYYHLYNPDGYYREF